MNWCLHILQVATVIYHVILANGWNIALLLILNPKHVSRFDSFSNSNIFNLCRWNISFMIKMNLEL